MQIKQVPGFPEYLVTDKGEVFSTKCGKVRKLVPCDDGLGYHNVKLCVDGRLYTRKIQRLVAEAFLGPLPEGKQIVHLNGIKTDNRVCNLVHLTPAQTTQHAIGLGLFNPVGENNPNSKLSVEQVEQLRLLRGAIPAQSAAQLCGVSQSTIYRVAAGRAWKHLVLVSGDD